MKKNLLYFLFITLRPNVWPRIASEMLFGAALAPQALAKFPELFLGFLFIGPLIGGASYALNDISDKKLDVSHPFRKQRPIARGIVSVKTAAIIVCCFFSIAILCSLLVSIPFACACTILIASEILYTLPPFRFKEIVFFDIFLNAINALTRFTAGYF